jgi:hypothetical protein
VVTIYIGLVGAWVEIKDKITVASDVAFVVLFFFIL